MIGDRLFGRHASLRTSYAFTVYGGDERGIDVRNRFETFRVGLIDRFARNANSEHLFVGVRF